MHERPCVFHLCLCIFLSLIISTDTRKIKSCSSLLCDSWSFIQQQRRRQQQYNTIAVFCFESLRAALYTSCISKLSLDSCSPHPTLSSASNSTSCLIGLEKWFVALSIILIKQEYQYLSPSLCSLSFFLFLPLPSLRLFLKILTVGCIM